MIEMGVMTSTGQKLLILVIVVVTFPSFLKGLYYLKRDITLLYCSGLTLPMVTFFTARTFELSQHQTCPSESVKHTQTRLCSGP